MNKFAPVIDHTGTNEWVFYGSDADTCYDEHNVAINWVEHRVRRAINVATGDAGIMYGAHKKIMDGKIS